MLKLERRPLLFTISLKTASAAGLLHMLPKHTNSTEKSFLSVDGVGAIDAVITGLKEEEESV